MGRGLALCCRMETSRIIPAPNGRYIRAGIAQDMIDLIPAYRDHPLVKQAVEDMKPHLEKLEGERKEERGMERSGGLGR